MANPNATERQLGGLALSGVQVQRPMLGVRAFHWHNTILKLGMSLPFWVVHDLGLLMIAEDNELLIATRSAVTSARPDPVGDRYVAQLRELRESEVFGAIRRWKPGDDLVAMILLRVLSPLYEQRLGGAAPEQTSFHLNPKHYEQLPERLTKLASRFDYSFDVGFRQLLVNRWISVVIAVEQIDLDTLQLLGLFGVSEAVSGGTGLLDLFEVLQQPEANDIVNFSLDLLPSVLETKRTSGQQSFAVDGFAGLTRQGAVDSMVFSELAFDEDLFVRRYLEREVFYYARERQNDEHHRVHYIAVDASASMRGQRNVFARGLALTLLKKLLLSGDEVYIRFFDSHLYEVMKGDPSRGPSGGVDIARLLSFRGERGRNYARVGSLLTDEMRRVSDREGVRPTLYLITHAECHMPVEVAVGLANEARLYGVFMMPSQGELDIEYVECLDTVQIVNEAQLFNRGSRAARALSIVDDAASVTG